MNVRHGTISGYKYRGCRCADCRAASIRYEKGRRWLIHQGLNPTVPAHGFIRRVHALMALGWTQKQIAAELGIAQGNLMQKLRANQFVRRATHESMVEVYERLCMTRQTSTVAKRTASIAAKRGWPPPLAWDDIDDESEQPRSWQYVGLNREEVLADLDHRGANLTTAATVLGISAEGVERWCQRHGHNDLYRRLVERERPHRWANQYGEGGAA